jgi:hypothetical protein
MTVIVRSADSFEKENRENISFVVRGVDGAGNDVSGVSQVRFEIL